jgi:hypothetical protein
MEKTSGADDLTAEASAYPLEAPADTEKGEAENGAEPVNTAEAIDPDLVSSWSCHRVRPNESPVPQTSAFF